MFKSWDEYRTAVEGHVDHRITYLSTAGLNQLNILTRRMYLNVPVHDFVALLGAEVLSGCSCPAVHKASHIWHHLTLPSNYQTISEHSQIFGSGIRACLWRRFRQAEMNFEQLLLSLWEHVDVNISRHREGTEHRVMNNSLKKKPVSLRSSLKLAWLNVAFPFAWVSCCCALLSCWQENGKVSVVVGMLSFVNTSHRVSKVLKAPAHFWYLFAQFIQLIFLAAVALLLFQKDFFEIVALTTFYPNILLQCVGIVGKVNE